MSETYLKTLPSLTPVLLPSQEHKLALRWSHAIALVGDCVETHPGLRGGIPCLKGTRVTVAQILAQLADGESIDEIADDMSLDRESLAKFLNALSIILDRIPA